MPGLIDATNGGEVGNLWDGHSFTKSPEQITADEAHEAKIALEAGKPRRSPTTSPRGQRWMRQS
jgi:hypothetical protein